MENVNVGKNLLEHMSINVVFDVQVLNKLVHNILLQYTAESTGRDSVTVLSVFMHNLTRGKRRSEFSGQFAFCARSYQRNRGQKTREANTL